VILWFLGCTSYFILFYLAKLVQGINDTLPYIGMAFDHPNSNVRLSVVTALCKFSEHRD